MNFAPTVVNTVRVEKTLELHFPECSRPHTIEAYWSSQKQADLQRRVKKLRVTVEVWEDLDLSQVTLRNAFIFKNISATMEQLDRNGEYNGWTEHSEFVRLSDFVPSEMEETFGYLMEQARKMKPVLFPVPA